MCKAEVQHFDVVGVPVFGAQHDRVGVEPAMHNAAPMCRGQDPSDLSTDVADLVHRQREVADVVRQQAPCPVLGDHKGVAYLRASSLNHFKQIGVGKTG